MVYINSIIDSLNAIICNHVQSEYIKIPFAFRFTRSRVHFLIENSFYTSFFSYVTRSQMFLILSKPEVVRAELTLPCLAISFS